MAYHGHLYTKNKLRNAASAMTSIIGIPLHIYDNIEIAKPWGDHFLVIDPIEMMKVLYEKFEVLNSFADVSTR